MKHGWKTICISSVAAIFPYSRSGWVFDPCLIASLAKMDGEAAMDLVHRFLRRDVVQLFDQRFELLAKLLGGRFVFVGARPGRIGKSVDFHDEERTVARLED